LIFHLALRDEWREAVDRGEPYRRSTLGKSLSEVGFIHCSYAAQVEKTADLFYRGRDDVVLLTVDPSRLACEVRVEQSFPHVYGPIPTDAVVAVTPIALGPDGRLALAAIVRHS
jgi:uncharacterized protein (DUF952 family)